MFKFSIEKRLSEWVNLRNSLEKSSNPLQEVWDFWNASPFVPYNKKIDPFYSKSWPTPWEIISENVYDDFTRALMISWTLKLIEQYKNSKIEIRIMVDKTQNRQYNLILIDDKWVINFDDNGPVEINDKILSLTLENLIEIDRPR